MLTEKQQKEIVIVIGKRLKTAGGDAAKCVWTDGYKESCDYAEQICVHSEIGRFPEKLMIAKAPNETKEEIEYRRQSFESITYPYWMRAESALNRIWAKQNYTIAWPQEAEIQEYFSKQFPIYKNIFSYFQSVVTKAKVRDPNAVLCVDIDLPVKETAEGERVPDQSEQLEPYATIYKACDVCMYEEGDYALFMSEEKSEVEYSGKKLDKGFVFYLYDDAAIYRIAQTGKWVDWTFTIDVYYKHNLDYLPAWKLKGIPHRVYADNPIYQSYFMPAVPHLNKAIKLDSTLDASISKVAYPTRTYYESKCNAPGCTDGTIHHPDKDPAKCGTCGGTGKMKFSPLKDVVSQIPDRTDPDFQLPFPAFAYVAPPTEILDFNKTKIKEDIIAAFTFLNIDVSNRATANGVETTATEIRIDRDEFYTFLLSFSEECFSLLHDFMGAAIKLRWIGSQEAVELSPPKVFDLTTPAELTEEMAKPGLPNVAKKALNKEYLTQRFTQNGELSKVGEIVDLIDAYSLYATQEMAILKSNNALQMWEWILHNKILSYIADEIKKNPEFLEQDYEAIKTTLIDRAKADAAEVQPASSTAEDIQGEMASEDTVEWKVGDSAKIKAGNEKNAAHKGAQFTITAIADDSVTLKTEGGETVTGYAADDLI